MRCWSHGADNRVIISKAISSFLWSFLPVIRGLLCRRFSPKHNMLKDLPKFGDNTPLLGQLLGDDLQQVALHLLQAAISTHLHRKNIKTILHYKIKKKNTHTPPPRSHLSAAYSSASPSFGTQQPRTWHKHKDSENHSAVHPQFCFEDEVKRHYNAVLCGADHLEQTWWTPLIVSPLLAKAAPLLCHLLCDIHEDHKIRPSAWNITNNYLLRVDLGSPTSGCLHQSRLSPGLAAENATPLYAYLQQPVSNVFSSN